MDRITKKQIKIRKKVEEICNPKQKNFINTLKAYLIITVGASIMAIGISLFLLPNELSTGGFAGIGTILYYAFNMPLGTATILLNIPLLAIAFFKIGKELFFRSVY